VGDRRVDLGEITDGHRSISAQAIGFDENLCFLEPRKKLALRAVEFDVTEGSVAEYVASDAHMLGLLSFGARGRNCKELLKCFFSNRKRIRFENPLLIVVGCTKNQGWFVFNHYPEELVHGGYRVEFLRGLGEREKGANRQIVLSRNRIFCRRSVRGGRESSLRCLIGVGRCGGLGGCHGRMGWIGHRST